MKWAYDLTGAEPIIKDIPVYDAATIAAGELVMLGASAYTAGADAGYAAVSARHHACTQPPWHAHDDPRLE